MLLTQPVVGSIFVVDQLTVVNNARPQSKHSDHSLGCNHQQQQLFLAFTCDRRVQKTVFSICVVYFTQGQTIDSEHLSELTEEEFDFTLARQNGFVKLDNKYLRPFFTRRFTQQVKFHGFLHFHKTHLSNLFRCELFFL